jgi:hypothetical protein
MFPFEYAKLLTHGNDLEAESVSGMEKSAERGEESLKK